MHLKPIFKSILQPKTTLKWAFAMILGPLVSIKLKGSSMCISAKTEICHFVHIIIIHNNIIIILLA